MNDSRHPSSRGTGVVALVLPALFLVLAIPLWATEFMKGRGAADQVHFHVRVIQQFAAQWPTPDLRDYPAAMSPAYHLLLTPVARVVGTGTALQMAASVFTVALLGLYAWAMVRRAAESGTGTLAAACAALPLACSMYVLFPGVWLQPDNAAWLLVLAIVLLTTFARATAVNLALAGGLLAVLVFTRQSHLWLAGPIWAAAWLRAGDGEEGASSLGALFRPLGARLRGLSLGVLVTLPALGVFAWLYHTWGGLMPAQQRWQFPTGTNWASPAFILALIGVYSVFLLAYLWPGLSRCVRESKGVLAVALLAGATVAIIPETTFLKEPRSSGLWNIVGFLDARGIVIAGRTSPLMVALSALGAVCLVGWLSSLRARQAWMFAAILAGFTAAQTANALCWQRYIEPMLLMLLGLMCVSARSDPLRPPALRAAAVLEPGRMAGPLLLAGLLLTVTGHALWTAQPPAAEPPNPSQITAPPRPIP